MTIANAQKFIRRGLEDIELRGRLNEAGNQTEIQDILEGEDLGFTPGEFDIAFYNTLKECQSQEAADDVKGFKLWWELLAQAVSE